MEASKFAFAFSTPAPVEKVSTRNIEGTPIIRFKGGSVGGKCVLNPKASMLLNMAPGDYAAFADNSKAIAAAAAARAAREAEEAAQEAAIKSGKRTFADDDDESDEDIDSVDRADDSDDE